jgi:hypothetical protein
MPAGNHCQISLNEMDHAEMGDQAMLFIMAAAMLLRLISVIWARGFGMHDDHFLVIEAAQSWVDGSDYNNWLPDPEGQINRRVIASSMSGCTISY